MNTKKGLNEANRPLLGGDKVCARVDKHDIERLKGLINITGANKSDIIRGSISVASKIMDKTTFERLNKLSKKYDIPLADVIQVAVNRLYLQDKEEV